MEQPESRAKLSSQVKMLGLWEKSKQVSGLAFFISPPLTAGEEQGEVQMTRIALSLCLPCTSPQEAKAESELGTHVPQALSPVLAGMATAASHWMPLSAVDVSPGPLATAFRWALPPRRCSVCWPGQSVNLEGINEGRNLRALGLTLIDSTHSS